MGRLLCNGELGAWRETSQESKERKDDRETRLEVESRREVVICWHQQVEINT